MINVTFIFLLAFLIRLIKIQDYLFFGFEQGRDAQIIEKIYKLQDFVLVGPSTSISGVFHGPWYYYLLALPYGLSGGNPLAASFFLIALGSLVPVVMYLLASELFKSRAWGIAAGIISIFSYEYVLYSRWLSNVSPAPLFIVLAFLMLWKYMKNNGQKYFFLSVFFAGIAVSFQMILAAQFIFAFFMLLIFRQLKISVKSLLLSLLILIIIFSPSILFDFRNQHITLNSLLGFIHGDEIQESGNPFGGVLIYFNQMKNHLELSLVYINLLPIQAFILVITLAGIVFSYRKKLTKTLVFLLSWILMGLPVIFISPGNPQYYAGIGLGWILLFVMTLKLFWESKNFKIAAILPVMIFFFGVILTINNLLQNKEVFFRTIQDDLNYKDQRQILNFIHNDSKGEPYKLVSFTIPSLQPQGWDYLKSYFYPEDPQGGAKLFYVVIEKNVYPVWENKWIADLGETNLEYEKKFGLIRLQKRTAK